jgi:hypothetical protein
VSLLVSRLDYGFDDRGIDVRFSAWARDFLLSTAGTFSTEAKPGGSRFKIPCQHKNFLIFAVAIFQCLFFFAQSRNAAEFNFYKKKM